LYTTSPKVNPSQDPTSINENHSDYEEKKPITVDIIAHTENIIMRAQSGMKLGSTIP
jgi:hypothetical protein